MDWTSDGLQPVTGSSPHKHKWCPAVAHICIQCKVPSRHYDVCLHHTYHADMIPGISISFQTAHSMSTPRLAAHLVSALTIHSREMPTLWSHNHDTGSYDTLREVDSSSIDVRRTRKTAVAVMCWYTGLWQAHNLYQITAEWWAHTNDILQSHIKPLFIA